MKTLILFSTRDGQTREIASYLASELKELGIQADVANVHRIEEPQWENYDRVVIGASIRYGHYHSCVPGICQKACDAVEFDAECLLLRKSGGA